MRPFKPEPEKAKSSGFLSTLKRGAKELSKDIGSKAKEAATTPPANNTLIVDYSKRSGNWRVKSPAGSTYSTWGTRSAAEQAARSKVSGTGKWESYRVIGGPNGESRGPTVPGIESSAGSEGPYVPDMGPQGGAEPNDDENQPYIPETLFDR